MSWRVPVLEAEGKIRLDIPAGNEAVEKSSTSLYILYDQTKFRAEVEPLLLEDPQLHASWGDKLYRILLTARKTPLRGDYSIRLTD
jgi:hypothetical protein